MIYVYENVQITLHSLKNNVAEAPWGPIPLFLRNGEIRGHSPT
jgi:hypothetical protein